MIARIAEVCPMTHLKSSKTASRDGIIRRTLIRTRTQWAEAFYLIVNKTRLSTPRSAVGFPLTTRVNALVAGVNARWQSRTGILRVSSQFSEIFGTFAYVGRMRGPRVRFGRSAMRPCLCTGYHWELASHPASSRLGVSLLIQTLPVRSAFCLSSPRSASGKTIRSSRSKCLRDAVTARSNTVGFGQPLALHPQQAVVNSDVVSNYRSGQVFPGKIQRANTRSSRVWPWASSSLPSNSPIFHLASVFSSARVRWSKILGTPHVRQKCIGYFHVPRSYIRKWKVSIPAQVQTGLRSPKTLPRADGGPEFVVAQAGHRKRRLFARIRPVPMSAQSSAVCGAS